MSDGERGRVLLVDPSGALERWVREAFERAGFAVEVVGSAGACLKRVREGDVDGVVSAYALPDLDGVRLLRSIRVSYPYLPFVVAPEDGSESLAGDALAAGADGYVPSGDDAETVVSRLRDSLEKARREGDDERAHRYRNLIEMSPAAINVFDEDGESIWCNDAVLDLLELDGPEDLIGRSIFEFVHPDDHETARREIERVIDEKRSTGPTRMRLRPDDGRVRYIHVSTAVGNFLGSDVGQAIAVDVTDREERDRQLVVLDQWLRHNIRNETTVIHGIAEAIEREQIDDVREWAGRIRDHAARLVEQARHERKLIALLSNPPDPVSTDVASVVEEVVGECVETYPDADIALTRADPVSATAIPELSAAVAELVGNAVEHSDRETPTVRVAVVDDGERGLVRVADDGPGIPERERNNLLLDHEITQLDHGTGLGLVFTYWVVRLSDGDVGFAENDPRGSVVTLSLGPSADA